MQRTFIRLASFLKSWQALGLGEDAYATLVVHPARKQTISRAEFPHGFVVVLDGRQPACVLRLAMRKFCSDLWSAF